MQLFDTEMMKREKGFVCNGCVHFVQLVLEKVSCTSRIVVLFFWSFFCLNMCLCREADLML